MINLLPDVRQAKLRERRRRQLASGISVLVWVVCGGIVVLMVLVSAGQQVAKAALTHDIEQKKSDLQKVDGLVDALTAQQHLKSLDGLYKQRAYMTKFFKTYEEADPTDVSLSSLSIDSSNLLTVLGSGKSYASVAKLARALAADNVSVGANAAQSNTPNFTGVNIKNVDLGSNGVSFTMTMTVSSDAVSSTGAASGSTN